MAAGVQVYSLPGIEVLASATHSAGVFQLPSSNIGLGGYGFSGHAQAVNDVVPGHVVRDQPEEWSERLGTAASTGAGQLPNGLGLVAKLRRAMVRPGREKLSGWVEVDETWLGGLEEGVAGRKKGEKALIVIAAEADGPGIGRIRMRPIQDAAAGSLHSFIEDSIERGSILHTDGWQGYVGLDKKGYGREVSVLRGRRKEASVVMPRVHRVVSLLKRWLLGTHQGAVSHEHLAYYLDEFTFRFNRRKSKSRGKLFYRLVQQAAATESTPYATMVGRSKALRARPQRMVAT